jgi:Spy/CpxP family protein refolding chaperone
MRLLTLAAVGAVLAVLASHAAADRLTSTYAVLIGAPQGPSKAAQDEEKERRRLRIGITKEQEAQLDALWTEQGPKRREIMEKMRDALKRLGELYDSYDFDREQARAIRREIVGLHARTMMLHLEAEEKIRKILTKEQFDKMRALMKEEWSKRMPPRPHGSRGGGPGGP